MTYPLIGNYGICHADMESGRPWPDGFIVRELSRIPSNFRVKIPSRISLKLMISPVFQVLIPELLLKSSVKRVP